MARTLRAVVPEIERRVGEAERATIARDVKQYFATSDGSLYGDVWILCDRLERGEYGAPRRSR
ncbi:hypothetical protein [Spirillospora sp. CA-128828]|uniref:hypothetical protein n=1 Tax=Spirillospora sp. CA-128828 TaxID=3240033 RepID=UPI003D8E580F